MDHDLVVLFDMIISVKTYGDDDSELDEISKVDLVSMIILLTLMIIMMMGMKVTLMTTMIRL